MRILNVTDSHGTMNSPESRTDQYYVSFLKKLAEFAYATKYFKADMVIHTGDLFHIPRPSDRFVGMVAEILKSIECPVYVVPGNHDIDGYNISTIDYTKLGLLAKSGVINILCRAKPLSVYDSVNDLNIAISGQEYYAGIDEQNPNDFLMHNPDMNKADFAILAVHGYVTPTAQHPNIKHTMIRDIQTDSNVILSGHFHQSFSVIRDDGIGFFNPGSMMRIEQTEYNRTNVPQYGILDITVDDTDAIVYDYNLLPFKTSQPGASIFNFAAKTKQKAYGITLGGFKTSISNTMVAPQSLIVQDIIHQVCNDPDVLKAYGNMEKETMQSVTGVLQNMPSEFQQKAGYMVSQQRKHIKQVQLHNFESHKDTVMDFDDGLNIIIGTSNFGKSAIFRGILWATDNSPLGNDFITKGEKDCFVRVTYSDGSYIERGRTQKESGYYTTCDSTGVKNTYKGFANNVPVEVDNIHQMPKVQITKDINVHLNCSSQFEPPFLMTATPAVKASAIGRITGTHIVDAAIKENSRIILGNKKVIKAKMVERDNIQKSLDAMPDLEAKRTALEGIYKKIQEADKLAAKINSLTETASSIKYLQSNVNALKWQVDIFNKIIGQKPAVDGALKAIDKMNDLTALTQKQQQLSLVTNELGSLDLVTKNAPLLSSIETACGRLWSILKDADKYKGRLALLDKAEAAYGSHSKIAGLKPLSVEINYSYQRLMGIIHIGNELRNYETIMASEQSIVDNLVDNVDKLTEAKKKEEENKLSYMSKVGVCPYCGQELSGEDSVKTLAMHIHE